MEVGKEVGAVLVVVVVRDPVRDLVRDLVKNSFAEGSLDAREEVLNASLGEVIEDGKLFADSKRTNVCNNVKKPAREAKCMGVSPLWSGSVAWEPWERRRVAMFR